jgi:hypothetical protein
MTTAVASSAKMDMWSSFMSLRLRPPARQLRTQFCVLTDGSNRVQAERVEDLAGRVERACRERIEETG